MLHTRIECFSHIWTARVSDTESCILDRKIGKRSLTSLNHGIRIVAFSRGCKSILHKKYKYKFKIKLNLLCLLTELAVFGKKEESRYQCQTRMTSYKFYRERIFGIELREYWLKRSDIWDSDFFFNYYELSNVCKFNSYEAMFRTKFGQNRSTPLNFRQM